MKAPDFLISELVLGRLKPPGELAAIAQHWNEEFIRLRHLTRETQGEARDVATTLADIAANRAYRIEAMMRERSAIGEGYLGPLLMTAKRRRDERIPWQDAAPDAAA